MISLLKIPCLHGIYAIISNDDVDAIIAKSTI